MRCRQWLLVGAKVKLPAVEAHGADTSIAFHNMSLENFIAVFVGDAGTEPAFKGNILQFGLVADFVEIFKIVLWEFSTESLLSISARNSPRSLIAKEFSGQSELHRQALVAHM